MRKLSLSVLVVLLITSCTTAPTPSTVAGDQSPPAPLSTDSAIAYPDPSTAYTAPEQFSAEPDATWTPASGTGVVTARLLLNEVPVVDARMYLADIIQSSDGVDVSASVDPGSSPRAYTDANGVFTFINVMPGRYSLILNNAIESYMIYKPGTQESFIVVVEADGKVDLGELNYTDLPITQ